MNTGLIVTIVILVVMIAAIVGLYFAGKKMQAKQEEQQAQVEATKQAVTLLIIDKKKMKIKDAGLPDQVYATTPWYLKRSKVPVVKVKAGPQILNMICDEKIFDQIPVKKTVKAMVSGIYISEVKGVRGQKLAPTEPQKQNWFTRTMAKIRKAGGAESVK